MMNKSSKSRLTVRQLSVFPGDTLFERIARAVCRAGTLPAKELYEAWEVARRVRRRYRGGRVLDFACGHGLLAHIMLLLDDSSPEALAVDTSHPLNAEKLSGAILKTWPRLEGRIHLVAAPLEDIAVTQDDLIVSSHACGPLTDQIIDQAIKAGARLGVLPCCHDLSRSDTGGLEGWVAGPLAVDVTRAARLRAAGYSVFTQKIPEEISPQNRLLMGHLSRTPSRH
jgi:SAM-dependent methyltransferase